MQRQLFGILLVLLLSSEVFGQQIPLFSQYFHNEFIYNPAWAGNYPYASANLTHRAQWTGFDDAPRTTQFTFDVPFYRYRAGLGANIFYEEFKATKRVKAMFTYAYHIFGPYENSSKLSFGISGGVIHDRTDYESLFVIDENDPIILNRLGNTTNFELAFGINYLYRNRIQIGIATPQLLNPGLTAVDDGDNSLGLTNHFLGTLKFILDLPDGYTTMEPMVMLRYAFNAPLQYEPAVRVSYADLVWVSGAYRPDYAVSMAVGIKLDRLRVGYARDFSIGDFVGTIGSTNEIMIGYKFRHLPDGEDGQKGVGWGLQRKKVAHPSRPGPLFRSFPKTPKGDRKKFKGGGRPRATGKYRRF